MCVLVQTEAETSSTRSVFTGLRFSGVVSAFVAATSLSFFLVVIVNRGNVEIENPPVPPSSKREQAAPELLDRLRRQHQLILKPGDLQGAESPPAVRPVVVDLDHELLAPEPIFRLDDPRHVVAVAQLADEGA